MPNIQVKNVPADVHEVLARRAAAAGQSLQEYLSVRLALLAARPTNDELFARIARDNGGEVDPATVDDAIDEERAAR